MSSEKRFDLGAGLVLVFAALVDETMQPAQTQLWIKAPERETKL